MSTPITTPAIPQRARGRRLWRAALVITALLTFGGIAAVAWEAFAPRPDLLLMRHVQPGMTLDQVSAVFGARPVSREPWEVAGLFRPSWQQNPRHWLCDAGIVEVCFDDDGHALGYRQFSYGFGGKHPVKRQVRSWLAVFRLAWLVP